jgi:hypothetical protein
LPRRDNPTQLLDQMFMDIAHTRRIAPKRLDNLRLAGSPLQGTDYDRAGGKGGISDPTPTAAEQLEQWHRHYDDAIQAIIVAAAAVAHARRVLDKAPSEIDTAKIAEQQRCSGGNMGMDGGGDPPPVGWAKPECHGIYEKSTGHNQGLCGACIKRRNRWEQDQQALAS